MPIEASIQTFVDLTLELSGTLDPRTVMQRILEKSVSVADADRATLSSLQGGRATIEAGVGWGEDVASRSYDAEMVSRQPAVTEMIRSRQTVLGGSFDLDEAHPHLRDVLARAHYTAVVPILQEAEVVGMLVLSRFHDRSFKPQDVPTLTSFGALAGLALRNAKLYEEARNAARRLEAAETTKREFMNIAVHEMRGPLTIIEGYTEMLLAEAAHKDPDVAQQLAIIRRQAEHARGLAEDLLILARLESDDLGVRSDTVPIGPVISDVVERLRPRAELRHGAVVTADLDSLSIRGDRNLLERILDNLVGNAIDYSGDSPAVTVDASLAAGEVLIRVGDAGIGVPDDEHESIFGRFARGTRSGRVRGSGLGLYLSRECARRMGGDLAIDALPRAVGSSFVVRLPAA